MLFFQNVMLKIQKQKDGENLRDESEIFVFPEIDLLFPVLCRKSGVSIFIVYLPQ